MIINIKLVVQINYKKIDGKEVIFSLGKLGGVFINREIVLETKRIYFTNVSYDLIDEYLKLFNNPNIKKFITADPNQYTYENRFLCVKEALETDTLIILSMFDKQSGRFIGNIDFDNITSDNAEIGIIINEEFQNNHYGWEALKRFIDYGFNNLNLDEINLVVYSNNYRVIHLYEKLGFVPYKTFKNVAIIDGENVDDIYMKLHK